MKKLILSIAVITFMAGTVTVSFGQEGLDPMKIEKKVVLPQQEFPVAQIDSVADFQNLTRASEIRFIENEKSITDLKLKNITTDTMKKTAKNNEIDLLEKKNNFLRQELVSYKKEGKTVWKSFREQFNSDMDKLTEDLEDMKKAII